MRRLLTCAVALSLLVPPAAYAASSGPATPSLSGGQITAEGFDKCAAPPSSELRSWLASPYRVVNIYFAGNNRACADQPELNPQWLSTVTSNGWSVIPTYVGSQASCTSSSKTDKISASTAATQGMEEADDAATQMAALGMPAGANNPIYFDMEPYSVGSSHATCDNAVLTFLDAWSRELHVQGYLSGIYGTTNTVMKQLVSKQADATFQQPDDIWYADWNGSDKTTGESGIPDDLWAGHRIHQFRGGHNETFNGNVFNIDNDAVGGDVVAAATPTPPEGPPYAYAAAPPAGGSLREHSTPDQDASTRTGVTYASESELDIVCQTIGENVDGSVVWDQLSDGGYVSDIFTTTTGGLTFTAGVARCDTTRPVAGMGKLSAATLRDTRTVSWSGTDDASGVTSYDVRVRNSAWNADLGSFHRLLTATTQTSTVASLKPGTRYCFEARAIDGSGNVGAWSAQACVARALDDRSLTAGNAWRRLAGKHYFLHTATSTQAPHSSLRLSGAHVSLLGIVAPVGPRGGSVAVYVGGHRVGTVSLHSSTRTDRKILLLPAFSARVGDIRLKTTQEDALVSVDGLVISG